MSATLTTLKELNDVLYTIDPLGLICVDAPRDEYVNEALYIMSEAKRSGVFLLPERDAVAPLIKIIRDVFKEAFEIQDAITVADALQVALTLHRLQLENCRKVRK
jgi:hypothetical protein